MRTVWSFVAGLSLAAAAMGVAGLGAYQSGYRFMRKPVPPVCEQCVACPTAPACPAAEPVTCPPSQPCAAEREDVPERAAKAPAPGTPQARARKELEEGNHSILMGNFDKAVKHGKQALELDPELSEAHKLLGVAYARVQKYCEAKVHYGKYVEENPTNSQVSRIKAIMEGPELKACP